MHFIKSGSIYLFSSLISKAVPFLLLPVMTNYLSPEEFGKVSIFMVLVTSLSAFVGMQMQTNIASNFYSYSKEKFSLMMGNIFIISSMSTLILLIISMIIGLHFKSIFSIPIQFIYAIPLICFFSMANTVNLALLRNEERALAFGLFEVSNTLIKNSISLLFLIVIGLGWLAIYWSTIISSLIFFVASILYLINRNYVTLKYNRSEVCDILSLSLPLIPHAIAGMVLNVGDRLFIEQLISIEAVGIYTLGYSFGMIMMLFTDAFIKAWSPWFYRKMQNPDMESKLLIVKYTYLYIFGSFLFSIALGLSGKILLPYIASEEFHEASDYIIVISIAYAFRGIYQIMLPYMVHIKKTIYITYSTFLSSALNIALNYFLIVEFGVIGAAYATIFSFFCGALLLTLFQMRSLPMPWLRIF